MKFAVIDIGSNTIKLNIYENERGRAKQLDSAAERAALASYKSDGVLRDEGVLALLNIMRGYSEICRGKGVFKIFAFATQSLRDISNSDSIIDLIRNGTGIDTVIISGEEEARLGFKSFIDENGCEDSGILLDMGGGSTEITEFDHDKRSFSVSLPFGALSLSALSHTSVIPDEKQTAIIRDTVEECIRSAGISAKRPLMFGTGGTVSGALKLCKKTGFCKKDEIKVKKLKEFFKKASAKREKYEKLAKEILPQRYDSVFPGIYAITVICDAFCVKKLIRSKTACRLGFANELIERGLLK